MHIPAFCDTCGIIFRSGIVVKNSTNVTFSGIPAGPCPACGGTGHVPDGVFNFVGNTIEILSAPQRTVEQLSRLARILREAQEKRQNPDQIAETIRNEVPELTRLADLLPKTRTELYSFLALIVTVITLLMQVGQGDSKATNVTVTQTINQVFIETDRATKPKDRPTNENSIS